MKNALTIHQADIPGMDPDDAVVIEAMLATGANVSLPTTHLHARNPQEIMITSREDLLRHLETSNETAKGVAIARLRQIVRDQLAKISAI